MPRSNRLPSGAPTSGPPEPPEPEVRVPLRLTVARGALGLELYEPVELGPLEVVRLGITLPNLKFPVDLSGGVRLFRHRRGRLQHIGLSLSLDALARWLDARVREALGGLVRPVSIWRVEQGIAVGLVGNRGAVAFDLLWAPVEGDARFVVARARGAELDGPSLAVALSIVDTAVGRFMSREGRSISLPRAAVALGRAVLPAVGARAASAVGVRCSALEGEGDRVHVDLDVAFPPPGLAPDVVRAIELAELTRVADDALGRGELDSARAGYVAALERAPRHPEVCRLVAEIDAYAGGRAEGALSVLTEALPAADTGVIGAKLLARVGDVDGAREALRVATRDEEFAPLASLLWWEQASLEADAGARLQALDAAVARCPGLARVRWTRFEARLRGGDVVGALADAEHLEAATTGVRARHDVLRSAGTQLLELGYPREAGRIFERALRYAPDDPAATAGLGRALLATGRTARAVALLERAIAIAEAQSLPEPDALLELAKVLAQMGDLPQAIARARQVQAPSPRLVEARALEAQWRERIGDLAGASVAYGRLRETVETVGTADPANAVDWLRAAGRFEWQLRKDAVAAERHLAGALRLAPTDRRVADEYREIAAQVAAGSSRVRSEEE